MSSGLFEGILRRRYGAPRISREGPFVQWCWNDAQPEASSVLYLGNEGRPQALERFPGLATIYGDAVGGFLIGDSLKLAMLVPHHVYGLYHIAELLSQPELLLARRLDPAVEFFMDAANVWYYGQKGGNLYVFDAETSELDALGPLQVALEELLGEWASATSGTGAGKFGDRG